MKIIAPESLSPEWHAARRNGLTATDAAAVLGVHKFRTPLDVWNDKLHPEEQRQLSPQEIVADPALRRMEAGNRLEPVVRDWYADLEGCDVTDSPGLCQHDEHPWMLATPDGLITSEAERTGLFEAKTGHYFTAQDWDDGVPLFYQIQCQQGMAVTGTSWAGVAALLGGNDFRTFRLERDDEFIGLLQEKLLAWWDQYVLAAEMPPATERDDKSLRKMFPEPDPGTVHALSGDAIAWADRYRELGKEIKALENERMRLKNRIRAEIGEAEFGAAPTFRIKTATVKREAYTVDAKTYRDFRFLKPLS